MADDVRKVGDLTLIEINQLREKTINKYYNGRRGCMCGCLGNYYDAQDSANKHRIERALNRLLRNPDAEILNGYILYSENLTRTSAIYFQEG